MLEKYLVSRLVACLLHEVAAQLRQLPLVRGEAELAVVHAEGRTFTIILT